MAKLTLNIPDELITLIKKRNGNPKKYIEAVLINPLLEQLEYEQKKKIFSKQIEKLDSKLKDHKKQFTIK